MPGLLYLPQFVNAVQHNALVASCLALRRRVAAAADGQHAAAASIPQPEYVKSAEHNLRTEEAFVPVQVDDDGGDWPWPLAEDEDLLRLRCEHFARYGEDGHELTYFRGNRNIPRFVSESVVKLAQMKVPAVKDLAADLNWKLTMNAYRAVQGSHRTAGFPFHVDIPANGEVTMILSLQRGATLQLAHEGDIQSQRLTAVEMEPGGLLVLSGEARYNWRHRVLPMEDEHAEEMNGKRLEGDVRRISLVLGSSPIVKP